MNVLRAGGKSCIVVGIVCFLGLIPVMAFETIPTTINYQGKLAKQNGDLVNEPSGLQMTFHIYDASHNGNLLWTEVQPAVVVTQGQFSVDLGSITPFNLPFDQPYYLGITVAPDTVDANPRRPLTSVGYALNSVHAQNSEHATTSDHGHSETSDTASHGHSEESDHSQHSDRADSLSAGTQTVNSGNGNAKGLIVKAANGQSANLQEWQDSSGTPVASVGANGQLNGNGAGLTNVHANNSDRANRASDSDHADALIAGTQRVSTGNATAKGLIVQAAVAQSENLQEWQDSAGAAVASVSASGVFNGNGSGLTGLSASSLSGTLASAQLSGTYSNALTLSSASNSFTGDGAALTGLSASSLASGTLPSARLSGTYSSALTLSSASNSFTGNGANLTALNATNLTTGTVPGARLSGTYSGALTLSNASNSFTGDGSGISNVNVANYARKINEQKVAVVVSALQSGMPAAGSGYYGTPLAALTDLAAWCGTPSQANPCLIRVMPGTYNANGLPMTQWVDIVGSGENSTRLVGPVIVTSNSALSFLTLEGSGGGQTAVTLPGGALRHMSVVVTGQLTNDLVSMSGSSALEDVSIVSLGGSGWEAVGITSGSPSLTNVRISVTGVGGGIKVSGTASPALTNISIAMSSNTPGTSTGIAMTNGSTPTLTNVSITASGSTTMKGFSIDGSSPLMSGVVVRLAGGAGSQGVETVDGSVVIIDNSVVDMNNVANGGGCPQTIRGVRIDSSSVEMRGVTVRLNGCTNVSKGVEISGGPTSNAKLDHCVISAGTALQSSAGAMQVGASKLDAAVATASGGMFTCVYTYNGNYFTLNASCL